jgi:hypothetical protein
MEFTNIFERNGCTHRSSYVKLGNRQCTMFDSVWLSCSKSVQGWQDTPSVLMNPEGQGEQICDPAAFAIEPLMQRSQSVGIVLLLLNVPGEQS